MDDQVSLEIGAYLLRLSNGAKLDDYQVATVVADAIASVYGDFNQDDPEMSGKLEEMERGRDVLERALQQYEVLLQMTEIQKAEQGLGAL